MANEVYLIDIPRHEVAFIKDVCQRAAAEVYGDTDIVFETVEKSRANICIKMKKYLQETFMIVVSQGVLDNLGLSSDDDSILYSYADSNKFLTEVTDMFGFEYKNEVVQEPVKDESELDIVGEDECVLDIPVSSILNTDTESYLRSRNNTLIEENVTLRREIERLRDRSNQESTSLSIKEEAELTICKTKLTEKEKLISDMKQEESIQKRALEEAILKRKEAETEATKYRTTCSELSSDKTNLMSRLEMLNKTNQELKEDLKNANEKCTSLQEENIRNIASLKETHNKEVSSYLSDLSDMRVKKENAEIENNQLKIDIDAKVSECEQLKQDLEGLKDASSELVLVKAENVTLKSKVDTLKNENASMSESVVELSTIKSEYESLKSNYEVSSSNEKSLTEELSTVREELELLRKDGLSSTEEKSSLLAENARKEEEIKKLNEKLVELIESTKSLGSKDDTIEKLKERVAKLELEKVELKTTIDMGTESPITKISKAQGVGEYYEVDIIDDIRPINNLRVVYAGSSESVTNLSEFVKSTIEESGKETVILDFSCDTDIDAIYKARRGFSPLCSYLDGLVEIDKCVDLESVAPVKYTKLSRGYINDSYIINMDWGKLLSWVREYTGEVIINMGVLSSIKLVTLRNLCKVCRTDVVLRVTPANVRSAVSFMYKIPHSENIRYNCYTISNNEEQNKKLLSRLNQEIVMK